MSKKNKYKEFENLSKHFDGEFSGAVENTDPLTAEEMDWYKQVILERAPKVQISIRLDRWIVNRAKALAKKKGLKGYQTLINRILAKELL